MRNFGVLQCTAKTMEAFSQCKVVCLVLDLVAQRRKLAYSVILVHCQLLVSTVITRHSQLL